MVGYSGLECYDDPSLVWLALERHFSKPCCSREADQLRV